MSFCFAKPERERERSQAYHGNCPGGDGILEYTVRWANALRFSGGCLVESRDCLCITVSWKRNIGKDTLQVFSLLVHFRKLQEIAQLGHTAQWQAALALGGGALPFDLCSATVAACGRGLMGRESWDFLGGLLQITDGSLSPCIIS